MKKTLLIIAAMVLVCCISVLGTLAFLKDQTSGITNTFTAGEDLTEDDEKTDDYTEGLHLYEYEVTKNDDGSYTLGDPETKLAEGTGYDGYKLLPGLTLPKKAAVKVDGKTETPAYLYIEVVDELPEEDLTYSVDSENWTLLADVTGPNGGDVYASTLGRIKADTVEITILTDNKITIADDFDVTSVTGSKTLSFYAYLAQASAGKDAKTAFEACFGN